jgi:AraC family transcriptional regulator
MSKTKEQQVRQEMVLDRGTGKQRPFADGLIASSAPLNWQGILVEQHRLNQYDASDIMWFNHVVTLHLGPPAEVEFKSNGDYQTTKLMPGQICIRPAMSVSAARTKEPVEFATVSLTPEFMSLACCDLFKLDTIQLEMKSAIHDPYAESVCRTLLQETIKGSPTGNRYAESLATSLAVHLASQHGGGESQTPPRTGGLTGPQLKRAIGYVHGNLSANVSLRNMADTAGLSPFHFARQFKISMGYSPYQFVLRQRIERAKQLLIQGEKSLADIAVEVGFYDQSHFAQQFKRHCGITPKKFANKSGYKKPKEKN